MSKFFQFFRKSLMVLLCVLATEAWSQNRTITGTVNAEDENAPIPGANVLEKGTTNGTVTDASGNYTIHVKEGAVLVFSFVGYATQELTVGNQTTMTVSLAPDISTLSEVVVIGYGT